MRSGNLSEVDCLHDKIKEISLSHKNIYRAIKEFYDLSFIPIESEFYLVCILSILESLLVEFDKSKNNDKISVQLCEKLTYINECLNESKLEYKNFFKGPDVRFKTLIMKIYKYRSDIAHGNERYFVNKLQVLNSKEKVFEFAYQLVKAVVNYSINCPDVVSTLKKSRL